MPRAFDRRIPPDDHNPLRNQLDFNNPGAAIDDGAQLHGDRIRGGIFNMFKQLTHASDDDLPRNTPLLTWINKTISLLTNKSPLNSRNLTGTLSPRHVAQAPAAATVDTRPNLLVSPHFAEITSIDVAEQGWSWDPTEGRTATGTARFDATGFISELLSSQIPVIEGQKLDLSVHVKWTGLVFTGASPIILGVTRYKERLRSDGLKEMKEVGSEDLVSVGDVSPVSSGSSFPLTFPFTFGGSGGVDAEDSDWAMLSHPAYVVPAGCDEIRLRLKVDANLTAGTVWWDDAEVIKTQLGAVGTALDRIINGLENRDDNDWGIDDLLATMINSWRNLTNHATRIALLENLQSPGNKVSDEFIRTGTTLGPDWLVTYIGGSGGTWQTDGDMAAWHKGGLTTREARARYIGTPSTTQGNNQKILAVLGSKGMGGSHVDLTGRCNTTGTEGTHFIRARFSADGDVTITRRLAGVDTDLAFVPGFALFNPDGPKPAGASSTIALLCGTDDGPRFFEAQISGQTVATANDSTSAMGLLFQGYGAGVRAEGSLLGQGTPAKLNAWAAIDQ